MQAVTETGLAITNPLVLYRALVATKKIEPDSAQHRLALHLQKLYHRLKDYEPRIEYRHRLEQVTRTVGAPTYPASAAAARSDSQAEDDGDVSTPHRPSFLGSFRSQREDLESLALTRTMTSHEAAMQMDSPQGLLLYGEVGTGKSFLVDLLAESLPNRKKRRSHFNAFMLDTFARLERQRIQRSIRASNSTEIEHEHSLLSVARDLATTSPILFLDEFQLPDRASSKILTSLFTSFFQLGGVLIATSNRMPEELSKASGVEFAPPPQQAGSRLSLLGLKGMWSKPKAEVNKGMFSRESDFTQFLEVLKSRCETWNMESKTDFRRRNSSSALAPTGSELSGSGFLGKDSSSMIAESYNTDEASSGNKTVERDQSPSTDSSLPSFFFCKQHDLLSEDTLAAESRWQASLLQAVDPSRVAVSDIDWQQDAMNVYGRKVPVPKACNDVCVWTFDELCGTYLGPADYITLASKYKTIIIDEVPVLKFLQKNEARRFITLLDALYEARCRLLIRAEAGPDELFFPDMRAEKGSTKSPSGGKHDNRDDGVYAETFSEIFQDQTAPFRPNISSYSDGPVTQQTENAEQTQDRPHPMTRSILADEDADFGPVYGAGRSAGASSFDPAEQDKIRQTVSNSGPNFQRSGVFTGEDEKFAYKRAESRLWELCSRRWWDNAEDEGWWRPLSREMRTWEAEDDAVAEQMSPPAEQPDGAHQNIESQRDRLFRHGASPFRTHQDPPPKIPWTHTWGMVKWGKKAGIWGKGTDGIEERYEEKKEEEEAARTKPPRT